jgi:hypothetical protein
MEFLHGSRFRILAPLRAEPPHPCLRVREDASEHDRLLHEMIRMRTGIMRKEGALPPATLTGDSFYSMPGDDQSWHLLRLRPDGTISGCARVLVHKPNAGFGDLRIASCKSSEPGWASLLNHAVNFELEQARRLDRMLIEPGGWALAENEQGSGEGVAIAVAAFAWARILGDCVGFLTATARNCSSKILRRLGGSSLRTPEGKAVPEYFDARWGTVIELLRFDTTSLAPRFNRILEDAHSMLLDTPVFFRHKLRPGGEYASENCVLPHVGGFPAPLLRSTPGALGQIHTV